MNTQSDCTTPTKKQTKALWQAQSDVSQFSVLYGYVLFGAPDQGQTLDVYRSDF